MPPPDRHWSGRLGRPYWPRRPAAMLPSSATADLYWLRLVRLPPGRGACHVSHSSKPACRIVRPLLTLSTARLCPFAPPSVLPDISPARGEISGFNASPDSAT